jgi:putative drug exporter of the RND superfamily
VFARLGRWCFQRRKLVVGLWVAALVVLGAVLGATGTSTRSEFDLPDVESRRGTDILEENFGGQGAGVSGSIVFEAEQGIDDPAVQSAMEGLFDEVDRIEPPGGGTIRVLSPYTPEGQRQVAQQGDLAGRVAFATVELPSDIDQEEAVQVVEDIQEVIPEVEGVDILLGGSIFAEFEAPSSEVLGLAFAIVILILSFGSVLAMGLPVGVALAGIGVGTTIGGLLTHVVTMPDFATTLGVMIGLGVGIDYALFIVTRFRENLHKGMSDEDATVVAIDTAGRAVAFAGTTVVISLLGMLIMRLSFITGLAIGAAVVVATTMVASLTLLPALMGFAGKKVEVTRWGGLVAAGLVALGLVGVGLGFAPLMAAFPLALLVVLVSLVARVRAARRGRAGAVAGGPLGALHREVPMRKQRPLDQTLAYRWSRGIQHHPWRAALGGAALLLVLAVPVLGLRLGFSDEGNYPADTDTRQAYDLLADGFGPGFNGPLAIAADVPDGTDEAALQGVTDAVAATDGVAFASPPQVSEDGGAALWTVIPATAPQDEATVDLVNGLRDDVLPAATEGTGLDPAVTGSVAVQIDFSSYLTDRLPYFFGAVLALSFLLLMVVFRSVLVPLKAVIMNLLSIGAAFGVTVAIFQWGWGSSLFGVEGAPIEPFIPMMLFAIVFGLSMDYEVFLLSRVKEEWDRTGDSHTSVADGLAATARVITAAALIMVFVFGSFIFEDDRVIKLFGLGLATAVFLDATIVRMLLVPATMELLGDKNWWVPKWLDRILPRIEVEGHRDEDGPAGPVPPVEDRDLERV